jgi:hypothetical protein
MYPKVPPAVAVAILQVFKRVKFVVLWSLKKTIRATGLPELYLLLLCIKDMLSRHSSAQEITH